MKHPIQVAIENAINDVEGFDTVSVRSYSGRGMFGRECLSISADNAPTALAAVFAGFKGDEEEKDEVVGAISVFRVDNMGRGIIVYFPGITFVGEDEEENDCDEEENDCD